MSRVQGAVVQCPRANVQSSKRMCRMYIGGRQGKERINVMAWEWDWIRKKGKGGKWWVRAWYSDVYAVTLTKIGGETDSRISRKACSWIASMSMSVMSSMSSVEVEPPEPTDCIN